MKGKKIKCICNQILNLKIFIIYNIQSTLVSILFNFHNSRIIKAFKFDMFLKICFFYMYECSICVYICVLCMCVPGVLGGHKRVSEVMKCEEPCGRWISKGSSKIIINKE